MLIECLTLIPLIALAVRSDSPIPMPTQNDFSEIIVIKNGSIAEHKIIKLNATKADDDDDRTTAFTPDDEDVTANHTTTEVPDPTAATISLPPLPPSPPPDSKALPFPPGSDPQQNVLQRVLRALLSPSQIVIGPINLDLTGQSLFQMPFIREAFNGPLNFLNPFSRETATTPAP